MPWILNLQETYDAHEKEVGEIKQNRFSRDYTLLPVAHTTQNAHIEVTVTKDGEFYAANVIEDKNQRSTLIPSTVDSASRAGAVVSPYALHDKLNYTAGDFVSFGGKVGKVDPFEVYIENLSGWVNSPYNHSQIESIYEYLKKGILIEDLVAAKVIYLDDSGKMIKKWNKQIEAQYGERPAIFGAVTGDQSSAFVRFKVHVPGEILDPPWRNKEIFDSFVNYYPDKVGNDDICFVTGERLPSTEKHANKIRHAADKAKLISGNDSSGFTFRGKFNKSNEVANISYNSSQKAHNALKWLIEKQGKTIDGRVFLIWSNEITDMGDPFESSYSLGEELSWEQTVDTNESFAQEFSKAIDGFKNNLSTKANVNILVIDSATTGRMGVLYYRNMDKEFYFEKVKEWHTTCVWRHSFFQDKQRKFYIGAPATKDIAFAAYGTHASDKLEKGLMERMLPCVIEGKQVPIDIVRSAINRASNPVSMENWEWEKTFSIACALINKKEGLDVGLDTSITDRDYLFGRMLAVADVLERNALDRDEKRATNAIRYMNAFSKHPARTWNTIQNSIQPYQAKLGIRATRYNKLIDEIGSQIKLEDFNDQPLSGRYLLGMYSQRHELYRKKEDKTNNEEEA